MIRRFVAGFAMTLTLATPLFAQGAGGAARAPQPKFTPPDTMSTIRGTVTDSAGHALDSIEVYVMTSGQSARTDAAGRYLLKNLLDGHTRLRARRVGWRPVDTAFVLARHGSLTVNLTLGARVSVLDTIRVRSSQDDCAPRNFYGFNCRRRAGIGVFRDSAELAALKPDWDADLFDGIPGLRRDGHGVVPVTGWRCLVRLINGHPPTPIDREDVKRLGWVRSVVAIEFYARATDAPKWYKIYTWTGPSPCSLIVYWTR